MQTLFLILWFISLIVITVVVFNMIGINGLAHMFPEFGRWWHFPAQLVSLAIFAAVVIHHPF